MTSDLEKILSRLRADGYTVTQARRRRHWKVYNAVGQLLTVR